MRWLVIVAMVVCAARAAEADDFRVVVDRAELDTGTGGYALRVYASAVTLGGELFGLDYHGELHAFIDGVELDSSPLAQQVAAMPLDLVFVVEVAAAYRD